MPADWDEIGERYYRKREIYGFEWLDENGERMNLENYVIVGCPFGGPVAIIQDERKMMSVQFNDKSMQMRIFSPSGKLISRFPWSHRGLVKLGWSAEEHLIVVLDDGTIVIYDIHGKKQRQFSMGKECLESHIADACIWSTGLVVRTAGEYFQLWAVLSFFDENEGPFQLADPELERPPVCLTAIDPIKTHSGGHGPHHNNTHDTNNPTSIGNASVSNANSDLNSISNMNDENDVCVLVSTDKGGLYRITKNERVEIISHKSAIMKMCISSNGRMIAIYDDTGFLTIATIDLAQVQSKFRIESKSGALDMQWCGSDAIVLLFPYTVIVAFSNDFVPWEYDRNDIDNQIVFIHEIDSIKILTSNGLEMISIVPFTTQDIFDLGSTEPASLLFDSYEDFENQDARADQHRRAIADDMLEDAILDCLDAARCELEDTDTQTRLLKAAAYGKLFIKDAEAFDSDLFVETCRYLRVLNNLRDPDIGMPLTFQQFEILSPSTVVQRLIHRRKHLLAIRISKYLDLPVDQALEHWACCKIENAPLNVSDDALVKAIRSKLKDFPNFSYAKIARAARNRSLELAIRLIEHEPRARDQVEALLQFEENEIALDKAFMSLDTDLINKTLVRLISKYCGLRASHWKLFQLLTSTANRVSDRQSSTNYYDAIGASSLTQSMTIHKTASSVYGGSSNVGAQYEKVFHDLVFYLFEKLLNEYVASSSSNNFDNFGDDLSMSYSRQLSNNSSKSSSARPSIATPGGAAGYNSEMAKKYSKMLEDYYEYTENTRAHGISQLQRSLKASDFDVAREAMNKSSVAFSKDKKNLSFHTEMCSLHYTLLSKQIDYRSKHQSGKSLIGLSVHNTMKELIRHGDGKLAEQIQKEMKVSEKTMWHMIISVYSEQGNWNELERYIDNNSSKRRAPPVGYLLIIETFSEGGQKEKAKKYILMLQDFAEKMEWLCQLKFWDEAITIAANAKDMDALSTIRANVNDSKIVAKIDHILKTI